MRRFTILSTLLFSAFAAFTQNAEEANIKQAIRLETEAYFKKDITAWKSSWVHDAQVNRNFISRYGMYTNAGWDSIAALRERMFKQEPNPIVIEHKTDNYTVRTNGNMAWAEFDQYLTYTGLDTSNGSGFSREFRMLVKENDQWKIASQITTYPRSFNQESPQVIEDNLNSSGYMLLGSKKVNEAIEVFKLNVKLFPGSWNTYDSLGEAYAEAGNKKLAIENYEKSVRLNPKSDSGIEALKKLRAK